MAKVADFRPPSGGPKSPIFTTFPPPAPRAMDQFSCSAEILIVYAPRKFLDNHFMIVRGRAEPRHRADVRVMNVFTLMTPTLCTAPKPLRRPLPLFPLKMAFFGHPRGPPLPKGQKPEIREKWLFGHFPRFCPFLGQNTLSGHNVESRLIISPRSSSDP